MCEDIELCEDIVRRVMPIFIIHVTTNSLMFYGKKSCNNQFIICYLLIRGVAPISVMIIDTLSCAANNAYRG